MYSKKKNVSYSFGMRKDKKKMYEKMSKQLKEMMMKKKKK
tara:strand:- start:541 stop:660 length:120 start_codon:yes stop_codon:yes gene_type:complete